MYVDGRRIPEGCVLEADICIVGGGPAGISLAMELRDSPCSMIVLESGGQRYEESIKSLNDGYVPPGSPHAPVSMYRERRLGGASTIWGGRCVPLKPIDFEVRPHVHNSGWPIKYGDLLPYYRRAMAYCEAGEFDFNSTCLASRKPSIDRFESQELEVGLERFSPPTDFGKRYGIALKAAPQKILLYSTCVRLETSDSTRLIERVECATPGGNRFAVEAKLLVLAGGALETVRLMAASTDRCVSGVGNSSGALGHYYSCHVEGTVGTLRLRRPDGPIAWDFDRTMDGAYAKRYFRLPDRIQRGKKLRNMIVRLHHANPVDPRHGNPVLSLMFLAKRFVLPEYRRKITTVEVDALARLAVDKKLLLHHAKNVARGVLPLSRFLATWLYKRHGCYRRIPYVALHSESGEYPLDFNAEQTPLFESCVRLGSERDRFGVPKLHVDWKLAPEDTESIAETYRLMGQAVRRAGIGVIEFDDRQMRNVVPIGGHHIGTARMSRDPRIGVVNENCRAHDIGNLYLAGSAVFPTTGSANPTLTIVALALRLADHLKAKLAGAA